MTKQIHYLFLRHGSISNIIAASNLFIVIFLDFSYLIICFLYYEINVNNRLGGFVNENMILADTSTFTLQCLCSLQKSKHPRYCMPTSRSKGQFYCLRVLYIFPLFLLCSQDRQQITPNETLIRYRYMFLQHV